jgi:glycosyltransferase involved in cell wall biosynthesis
MTKGISVIICCFNSGKKIVPTLEHLAAQCLSPNIPWEIIVVDNCSSDDTAALAEETWNRIERKTNPDIIFIREDKPGLSHARKTGIYQARYEFICLCDDDNWLQQDYLSLAYKTLLANNEIGVLGGKGIAVSDMAIPEWFYPIQENFACGEPAKASGDISDKKWIWGAGMMLRNDHMRKLYESGFFHINSDRKGESLSSGGDTEICYWHILTGKKLWYDENLIFHHYITPERLTKTVADQIMKEHELSYNALHPYFPLVYANPYMKYSKLAIFFKAAQSIFQKTDGRFLYILLRPLFDWRLSKQTLQILNAKKKFFAQ